MSTESVMPSNHLILCHPLLLPPSIFPSIRVFSNESILHIRWPKYWSFSFNIPMNIQDWFPLGLIGLISMQSKGLSGVFFSTIQKHQFLGTYPSRCSTSLMIQFSSVTQSCPTLCNPINCSMPGLPVHNQLPEFTQTHQVGDAIQPSHPRSSPSPPASNPSQHQSLFQWVSSSREVAKVLEFQL